MKAAQALAQWLGGLKAGQSALAEAERKFEAHLANSPKSADATEHRAWLTTRRELKDNVGAEKAALAIAEVKTTEAKAAAVKEEADAEERRVRKLNDELAKVVLDLGVKFERLAPDVERYSKLLAEVEAWNAHRGSRPPISDGEARIREIPERVTPAVLEEITVWEDGGGNRPYQFRQLPNGELVPSQGGYTARKEKVVSRAEQVTSAHIPGGRFKDGIRLMGIKGEALFPTR